MTAIGILWEQRFKVLLVLACAIAYFAWLQQRTIGGLEAQLAAKPLVQEKLVTKTVQGPVHYVETIVEKPGGERVITRDVVREVKVTETSEQRTETPACPAPKLEPRWIAGVQADPFNYQRSAAVRGGVTLFNRVDVTVGHTIVGPGRSILDVAYRF